MKLRDYLHIHNITQSAFAKKIGCCKRAINRLCFLNPIQAPSLLIAAKIVLATKGEVRFVDLLMDKQQKELEEFSMKIGTSRT